jgi:uncharacterized protein YprB with RNaseH-like and TPR domain
MENENSLSDKIKILCFSDWRKNELDHIDDLIKKHTPDVLLYGGDDLKRFIPSEFFDFNQISKDQDFIIPLEEIRNFIDNFIAEIDLHLTTFQNFLAFGNELFVKDIKQNYSDWEDILDKIPKYMHEVREDLKDLSREDFEAKYNWLVTKFENRKKYQNGDFYKLFLPHVRKFWVGTYRSTPYEYIYLILKKKGDLSHYTEDNRKYYQKILDSMENHPVFRDINIFKLFRCVRTIPKDRSNYIYDIDEVLKDCIIELQKLHDRIKKKGLDFFETIFRKKTFEELRELHFFNLKWENMGLYFSLWESTRLSTDQTSEKNDEYYFLGENLRYFVNDSEIFFGFKLPEFPYSFRLYEFVYSTRNYPEEWKSQVPLGIHYVQGNDDKNSTLLPDCHLLDKSPFEINQYWTVIGQSGAPHLPEDENQIGSIIYQEETAYQVLKQQILDAHGKNIILLTHAPPQGCLDLSTRFSEEVGRHIGSKSIRKLIEEFPNIKLVICGHSHFWAGQTQILYDTPVLNVSNHDSSDRPIVDNYALITLEKDQIENIDMLHFGIDWKKVSGIGRKKVQYLDSQSIPSQEELEWIKINVKNSTTSTNLELFINYLQAKAKNEEFSFKITRPDLISRFISESIFLDIETESFATIEWDPFIASICVIHYDTKERQSWDIRKFKTVQKMIQDFKKYLKQYPKKTIYAWSDYDNRILSQYELNREILDLRALVKNIIHLPNYALKDVEEYLMIDRIQTQFTDGAYWGNVISHSLKQEEKCDFCELFLEDLIPYNMADVEAMVKIIDWIKNRI